MPSIKFSHVVSCSSEDRNYPAENLLKSEAGSGKWKCETNGEKQISIVLQFEKSSSIQAIDIGNEGSAFIEILVGRSTQTDQDFQVLLVASSFMNPLESRSGSNTGRVRMFTRDQLTQPLLDQKWDRVKLVCTQPFNKNVTYGVSFLRLVSPGDTSEPKSEALGLENISVDVKQEKKLGAFSMRVSDSPDRLTAGSIFAKRKHDQPSLSSAAAVRAASKQADEDLGVTPVKAASLKQARQFSDQDGSSKKTPIVCAEKTPEPKKHERNKETSVKKELLGRKRPGPGAVTVSSPAVKKIKISPPCNKPHKEFSKLLQGVTFVLSGYKNPLRGELREKGLAMGAKYAQDWTSSCTHLICAFSNTPKFNSVKGKGSIVNQNWLLECHKKRERLQWRSYRVDSAPSPPGSDGDSDGNDPGGPGKEVGPTKYANLAVRVGPPGPAGLAKQNKTPSVTAEKLQSTSKIFSHSVYDDSTDVDSPDTDDEINQIHEQSKKVKNGTKAVKKNAAVNADGFPILPDYFEGLTFFLYGKFQQTERRQLYRFITAFGGDTDDYMTDEVNFVVTREAWDEQFNQALTDYPNMKFVRPKWVFACHDQASSVSYKEFLVVKT